MTRARGIPAGWLTSIRRPSSARASAYSSDRPGLFSHLVQTLEAEQLDVGYSYATVEGDRVLYVFRTGDNPKAEDVLRSYLLTATDY